MKIKEALAGCMVMLGMFLLSCDNIAVVAFGIIPIATGAVLVGTSRDEKAPCREANRGLRKNTIIL